MSGLILLFALIVCFWLGRKLVRWVGQLVPNPKWKGSVEVMVALLLIASPFVDELIGWYQFNALCKAQGVERADVSIAKGRKVIPLDSNRHPVGNKAIPIRVSSYAFADAETNVILIRFNDYFAQGGWFMRYVLSFNGSTPMLFNGNGCGFNLITEKFEKNQITLIK